MEEFWREDKIKTWDGAQDFNAKMCRRHWQFCSRFRRWLGRNKMKKAIPYFFPRRLRDAIPKT